MKPEVEILRKARELLSKPESWTQRAFARDAEGNFAHVYSDRAACYCLLAALRRANPDPEKEGFLAARVRLQGLIDGRYHQFANVVEYNDAPERTHADVLALLDKAIEEAEDEF